MKLCAHHLTKNSDIDMAKYLAFITVLGSITALLVLNPSVDVFNDSEQNVDEASGLNADPDTAMKSALGSSANSNKTLPKELDITSLKGTDIDGAYPVDAQGRLVLSDDIKHRFEYFLSLMGEFPQKDVLQLVRDDIKLNLKEPALSEAMALFENYIHYKRTLVALEQQLQSPEHYEVNDIERMRAQLDALRNLRQQHLGDDVADAFYGFDDVYDDYMLNHIEIINNRQLTSEEKQQQLSSLQEQLPPGLQTMREDTQRISHAFQTVEKMKQDGATTDDVFQYNSQQFGQQAAFRLQELEGQRAEWSERIDDYLWAKADIEKDSNLSQQEKQQAIQSLQQDKFSANERKRLSAYE